MGKVIKIRKGYNIKLVGEASKTVVDVPFPKTFAIKPTDFKFKRFKLHVKPGDEVKAGTALAYDKDRPEVVLTAPVSGEIAEIKRGEKRVIEAIVILADEKIKYENFQKANPNDLSRQEIIDNLLKSGLWPMLRQRPYSVIADPSEMPRDIYISAFDSAPLAPNMDLLVFGEKEAFQTGLDAISKLVENKVQLNVSDDENFSKVFLNAQNVEINHFEGKHPAGNVGIQIHHLKPINKGEVVWYLSPQDIISIGKLFLDGKYDAKRIVALTGSEFENPQYINGFVGMSVHGILENNLKQDENPRIISGDVLTGTKILQDGYLGFYDNQITAIPEGDDMELFGWIMPSYPRPDISRSFHWSFMPWLKYKVNTNTHGEERPFVMTGQYEEVLPMDIYPMHLLKSIMYNDIEEMEALGIYEVSEEDFALCEFVCTSKTPVQKILREGLEMMYAEES